MDTSVVRKELVTLLESENGHATFDDILKGFPPNLLGVKPAGAPHTAWRLLEHLRIAQRDVILILTEGSIRVTEFRSNLCPSGSKATFFGGSRGQIENNW